jgi:hypothetical protein
MPKSAWPTAAELTSAIEARGGSVPAGIDLDDEVLSAVAEWEALTGYSPFKQESADSTRNYDSPIWTGTPNVLAFGCGYTTVTSVTVDGTALVLATDYWLEPHDAPSDLKPWTRIRFASCWDVDPQKVVVIGKRGYASSIPDLAWYAVLDLANMSVLDSTVGGPLEKLKQGTVEFTFSAQVQKRMDRALNAFKGYF